MNYNEDVKVILGDINEKIIHTETYDDTIIVEHDEGQILITKNGKMTDLLSMTLNKELGQNIFEEVYSIIESRLKNKSVKLLRIRIGNIGVDKFFKPRIIKSLFDNEYKAISVYSIPTLGRQVDIVSEQGAEVDKALSFSS